jgi:hypothetical protein
MLPGTVRDCLADDRPAVHRGVVQSAWRPCGGQNFNSPDAVSLNLGNVMRHVVYLAQIRRDPRIGKDAVKLSRDIASTWRL